MANFKIILASALFAVSFPLKTLANCHCPNGESFKHKENVFEIVTGEYLQIQNISDQCSGIGIGWISFPFSKKLYLNEATVIPFQDACTELSATRPVPQQHLILPDTPSSFNPDSCKSTKPLVENLVRRYQSAVANSQSAEADAAYSALHHYVFDTIGDQSKCFPDALVGMTSASLYIPTSKYIPKIETQIGANLDFSGNFIESPFVADLFIALYNHGRVEFLTQSKRKELGGAWLQTSEQDSSGIGSYDCAHSRLYIDPELRPVDLAIMVTHELDHLIRDKFFSDDLNKFKDPLGNVDWNLYNLADESSAIVFSASLELELRTKYKLYFKHSHYFEVDNDISLFAKDGLLKKLDVPDRFNISGDVRSELIFSMSSEDAKTVGLGLIPAKRKEMRNQLFETIWDTYFANAEVPREMGGDFDHFFSFGMAGFSEWWTKNFAGFLTDRLNSASIVNPRAEINELADILDSKMQAPSPSCKLYLDYLAKTPVTHYLGSNFLTEDASLRSANRPCLRFQHKL